MARQSEESQLPVSPSEFRVLGAAEVAVDAARDGEEETEVEGVDGERIRLPRDDEVVKKLVDPLLPSPDEVERHRLHLSYRNWCPVCVQSRGKESGHYESSRDRKIPEYCFDYFFPRDELGYRWTILAGKERITKSFMAITVPSKREDLVGTSRKNARSS